MVVFIVINVLEYKIERWIDKRNIARALGKNDEVWRLTMKIDNARNRMVDLCYWSFFLNI